MITKIPSEQDMSMYSNMHNDVQLFVGLQYRLSESFSAVTHHIKSLCHHVSYQFNEVRLSETGCSKDVGISNAWGERCHKTGRFFFAKIEDANLQQKLFWYLSHKEKH